MGLVFFVLLSIYIMIHFFTIDGMCKNRIIKQISLPSLNKKVIIFERNCGATTSFNTQVSIIGLNEALANKSGNIFIADTNHGKAPSSQNGELEIKVKTISKNHIKIFYSAKARSFKKEHRFKDILIDYGDL